MLKEARRAAFAFGVAALVGLEEVVEMTEPEAEAVGTADEVE